jgi:hypothetical protein
MKYSLNEKARIIRLAEKSIRLMDVQPLIDFFEKKILKPLGSPDQIISCSRCSGDDCYRKNVVTIRCPDCGKEWPEENITE